MRANFADSLKEKLRDAGIIAVIVLENPEDAPPIADALMEGGVTAVELALRTAQSLQALQRMRKHASDMQLGAGTVLTPDQLKQVRDAGVDFAVAPGTNRRVLQAANEARLPFGPGVAVPSDIETALEYGCSVLKFFPAEPSGGMTFLKSMAGPYAHLGLSYVPLGGLNENNIADYAASPLVLALGGSWIAPCDLIRAKDWKSVTQRAQAAREIVNLNRNIL